LHTGDVPVLASNAVMAMLAGIILCLKLTANPTKPS
jgi:hypothetical protein